MNSTVEACVFLWLTYKNNGKPHSYKSEFGKWQERFGWKGIRTKSFQHIFPLSLSNGHRKVMYMSEFVCVFVYCFFRGFRCANMTAKCTWSEEKSTEKRSTSDGKDFYILFSFSSPSPSLSTRMVLLRVIFGSALLFRCPSTVFLCLSFVICVQVYVEYTLDNGLYGIDRFSNEPSSTKMVEHRNEFTISILFYFYPLLFDVCRTISSSTHDTENTTSVLGWFLFSYQ